MHGSKARYRSTALGLGIGLAVAAYAPIAQAQTNGAIVVARTLVVHEITRLPQGLNYGGGEAPVLSAQGNRTVFALAPGTRDPANPNRIYVINPDGSGQREVDAYTTGCYCGSLVDISADGSTVISSDAVQLRIARADGGGGRTLVTLSSNEFNAIRISGDGSKVFFSLRRGAYLATGELLNPGIYVVNAEGGVPRQIVGTPEIARLLGLPQEQVPFSGVNANALSVSHDGSRIAFASYIQPDTGWGQGVFAVHLDGSGLVSLTGRQGFASVAISSDGRKVAYNIRRLDATHEVGMVNSDGTEGRRPLAQQPWNGLAPFPTGMPDIFADRLTLTADGSRLLLATTGVLIDTGTGAALQLAVRGGWTNPEPPIVDNGIYRATMDESATRFLYVNRDARGVFQLVSMEMNAGRMGDAPSVTEATITPAFVLTNYRSAATVTARVTSLFPFLRVSRAILRDGLVDNTMVNGYHGNFMLEDDGKLDWVGDQKAGDGLFTNNAVRHEAGAEGVGPRTVRIKAETIGTDGRRHATIVDLDGFTVRSEPPQ